MKEEKRLIAKARKGDRRAFEELAKKNADRIYALVFGYTGGNSAAAEDILQEIFLSAFRNIGKFRGRSGFFTWLFRIAVNASCDWKKESRIVPLFKRAEGELQEDPSLGLEASAEEAFEKENTRTLLREALNRVKERNRAVLILRFIEGKSYEEIMDICRCSHASVARRLVKGMKNLRESYEHILRGER